jgi:hypothetical protein
VQLVFTIKNYSIVNSSPKHRRKIKQLYTEDMKFPFLNIFVISRSSFRSVNFRNASRVHAKEQGLFLALSFNQSVASNPSSHKCIVRCISDYRRGLDW